MLKYTESVRFAAADIGLLAVPAEIAVEKGNTL